MKLNIIDVKNWKRREYFNHYLTVVPCTYSTTVNLDITSFLNKLKVEKTKLYPAMIFLITKLVNSHKEFRMAFNTEGEPGYYDMLHPNYTVFHDESELYSNIWSEYNSDFNRFYENFINDNNQYGSIEKLSAKPNLPHNSFTISSIPWVSFTSFNLNLPKDTYYLFPIFTMGKYYESFGKIYLPLAIQVNHAVCDGFHVSRFLIELQEQINQFEISI